MLDGLNKVKEVKEILLKTINIYEEAPNLLEVLTLEKILSRTNFEKCKTEITDKALADFLNTVLAIYSIARGDISNELNALNDDAIFFSDKERMVSAEIITYKDLCPADKRLFEIVLILNIL